MIIRVLILLLCALTCFSCNEKKSQKIVLETDKNTDPFRLKGMRVTSLDSILQDNDKNADIVFLYNFYDCGSCIDSGFQLVKQIDKFYKRKSVPIISSMGSPTLYQLRNQYFEFVYSDTNDLIRKELKYVQTPIMIRVDSNRMILDYLFPNVSDKNEYAHFLSSLKIVGI